MKWYIFFEGNLVGGKEGQKYAVKAAIKWDILDSLTK